MALPPWGWWGRQGWNDGSAVCPHGPRSCQRAAPAPRTAPHTWCGRGEGGEGRRHAPSPAEAGSHLYVRTVARGAQGCMTQRAQPSGSFLFPRVVSHVAPRPSPPSSPAFLGSGARAGTTGQTDQSRPVNALKVSEGRPGRAGAEGRGWRRLRPATGRAGEAGWPMQGAPSRASVSPSVYRPGSVQDSVSWAAAGWAPLPLPAAPPRPRPSGRFRASLPVRSPLPWRPCRCGDGAAPGRVGVQEGAASPRPS